KNYSVAHQIPVVQPEKLRDTSFIEKLHQWNADIFVVVAFRWLPREVWSIPSLGTMNVHGSLLPQYRGAAPINRAVMNGETTTGVTTFLIDKEIDTGKILLSESMSIGADEDAGSVHDRMMILGAQLLIRTLDEWMQHKIAPKSQDSLISATTVLHPAPKIFKEDCLIQWNQPAIKIHQQIRGLSPYPGAFTLLQHPNGLRTLKIFQALITHQPTENNIPGTIQAEKNRLFIACQDEFLELIDVQIDGKKRLKTIDFLRGIHFNEYTIQQNTDK
ncbi:MAG: methionyl-tRNA formyltransferase, partial [Bacteroidales bacterium]|nr:methionyl-tRNA formyltransferase [Bacteroidales bacterium]